jgi:hypothetical protein
MLGAGDNILPRLITVLEHTAYMNMDVMLEEYFECGFDHVGFLPIICNQVAQ